MSDDWTQADGSRSTPTVTMVTISQRGASPHGDGQRPRDADPPMASGGSSLFGNRAHGPHSNGPVRRPEGMLWRLRRARSPAHVPPSPHPPDSFRLLVLMQSSYRSRPCLFDPLSGRRFPIPALLPSRVRLPRLVSENPRAGGEHTRPLPSHANIYARCIHQFTSPSWADSHTTVETTGHVNRTNTLIAYKYSEKGMQIVFVQL